MLPTNKQQVKKIYEIVMFFVLLYSKWWLTCESAVDALQNDLLFAKNILKYQVMSQGISNSAFKAFSRHKMRDKWYLTPEMIPLSLFSDVVSDS
jgi:hypothetical protein